MKHYIIKIFFALAIAISFAITIHSGILASTCDVSGDASNVYNYSSSAANCPPTLSEFANVVAVVINAILAISVIVFFIVLVVNGFNFITSLGTPERIEQARKGLLFSVLGFALVFFSFVFLNIIISVTHLQGGITIQDGNVKFNLISSVTPSTVPSSINTDTPTATSP